MVGVDLVALRKVRHRGLLPQRLKHNLRPDGAREFVRFMPSGDRGPAYDRLFRQYQTLVADQHIRRAMHGLRE
jgi:hypothetical protein